MGILKEMISEFGGTEDDHIHISKPKEHLSVEKREDDPRVALISVKADVDAHIEPAGE